MVMPRVVGVDRARSQQSRAWARPSSATKLSVQLQASPFLSLGFSFFICKKRVLRANDAVDFSSVIWGFPVKQHSPVRALAHPC